MTRVHSTFRPIALFLIFSALACLAETANYLVIQEPAALSVFNRYEQALTPDERTALLPWSPFSVVEKQTTLGDQITKAARVKLGEVDYFILLDDDGKFIGRNEAGKITAFRDAETINDRVTVGADKAITFASGADRNAKRSYLPKGTQIVRYFRAAGRSYGLVSGSSERFGWFSGASSALESEATAEDDASLGISAELAASIKREFGRANKSYANLFRHFNTETGQSKSAPRWLITESENLIICTLRAPSGYNLAKSTAMLVEELESRLLHENAELYQEGRTIEIRAVPQ